jgi:hypothetical protein
MATTHTGTSDSTSGTRTSSADGMQDTMGQTPDTTYNLISVMYHTLQGCQTYEQYAQDAEQAGHQDVAQFFRDTGREFERCAKRGQQLLAQCLQQGQMGQGGRSGQLSSQGSGSSGQHSAAESSRGQQGGMSNSSGQQNQMSSARGQQGSGRYGSSPGSSGSTDLGNSARGKGSSRS